MGGYNTPIVSIVDDDESLRRSLRNLLESVGFRVEAFASAEAFLESNYGLNVTQQDADPADCGAVPPGTVCAQDPAEGEEIQEGDSATLFVQPGDASLPPDGLFAFVFGWLF